MAKSYGATRALAGIDLVVPSGSIVGLIGPNGSGKTTALHIAAGLASADSGRAYVTGFGPGSRPARRATAFVPDDPTGFDELTAVELVALAHALWDAPDGAETESLRLLRAFGLDKDAPTRLGELSRGRRRQAFVVAAASLRPGLLLVDEATATLDPESVVVLREVLRRLTRRGTGVLLATQDIHFAERTCDALVILHRGAVVATGSVDDVLARAGAASLEDAFLALCCLTHPNELLDGGLAPL